MKSLTHHIEEKLRINKNFKNADSFEELFDNVDFKYRDKYELRIRDDIFSIMVDYIRDHNVKSFSDFDSYRKTGTEEYNVYLVVFNKRIKEIDIFQKTADDTYEVFVIFKTNIEKSYIFRRVSRSLTSMHVLKNIDTWNNANEVEYYEISKETFDDISELYNKLIKK